MIDVLLDGRPMVMFALDVQERGEEIKTHYAEP
jgi:hypothetical protein